MASDFIYLNHRQSGQLANYTVRTGHHPSITVWVIRRPILWNQSRNVLFELTKRKCYEKPISICHNFHDFDDHGVY